MAKTLPIRGITPSPAQLAGFPLGMLLVLFWLFRDDLARRIIPAVPQDLAASRTDYAHQILTRLDTPAIHSVVIVVFWSLVGLVAYTLVWGLSNLALEARNEVVIESAYVNKGRPIDRVAAVGWQVARATLLFAFLLLTAYILAPFWVDAFGQLVYRPRIDALGVLAALGAVLGASINGYIAWVLARLALGRLH